MWVGWESGTVGCGDELFWFWEEKRIEWWESSDVVVREWKFIESLDGGKSNVMKVMDMLESNMDRIKAELVKDVRDLGLTSHEL